MSILRIQPLLQKSFETIKRKPKFYIGATLVVGIVLALLGMVTDQSKDVPVLIVIIAQVVSIIAQFVVMAGSAQFISKDLNGESVTVNDFFPTNKNFIQMIKGSLWMFVYMLPALVFLLAGFAIAGVQLFDSMLTGEPILSSTFSPLLFVVGVLCLVVGAVYSIIVSLKRGLFPYVIVFENKNGRESLVRAKELTYGNMKSVLLVTFVLGLINMIGVATYVGWILTAPLAYIAQAFLYKELVGRQSLTNPQPLDVEVAHDLHPQHQAENSEPIQ